MAEEAGASSGRAATAAGETGACASGKLCGTVTDYYDNGYTLDRFIIDEATLNALSQAGSAVVPPME